MKNTYIKYKDCQYPLSECQVWSDCITYYDINDCGQVTIIPNGEWTYHEEDIIPESKTFKQYQDEIDYQDKLAEIACNEFWEKNGGWTGDKGIELYKECNEYIKIYLKAHLPHQISFPADTLD